MPILVPDQDAPESAWIDFFESHGEPKLRMLIGNGGWPQVLQLRTVEWLANKDRERHARQEASQSEQIAISRAAKDAAERAVAEAARSADAAERQARAAEAANSRAKLALIVACVSAFISVCGVLLTHWDTVHYP